MSSNARNLLLNKQMNFINSIKELKRIQETEISPSKDIDSNNLLLKDLDNIDFNVILNCILIIQNKLYFK